MDTFRSRSCRISAVQRKMECSCHGVDMAVLYALFYTKKQEGIWPADSLRCNGPALGG